MCMCGIMRHHSVLCYRYTGEPLEELNPKKKIIERLFPDMKTNAGGCLALGSPWLLLRALSLHGVQCSRGWVERKA